MATVDMRIASYPALVGAFKRCRAALESGDAVYRLTFDPEVKPRTLSQNRLLHKWFNELSMQSGGQFSPAAVKHHMAQLFAPVVVDLIYGVETERMLGTSEMSKRQMSEYMEQIEQWAAEHGADLTQPEPDDQRRWRAAIDKEGAE